jgi:hypothetical protein
MWKLRTFGGAVCGSQHCLQLDVSWRAHPQKQEPADLRGRRVGGLAQPELRWALRLEKSQAGDISRVEDLQERGAFWNAGIRLPALCDEGTSALQLSGVAQKEQVLPKHFITSSRQENFDVNCPYCHIFAFDKKRPPSEGVYEASR